MELTPVIIQSSQLSLSNLAYLAENAGKVARNAKAANTLNAYASDWEDFENWCKDHGLQSLPASPIVVAAYLSDRALNYWIGPAGRLRKLIKKPPLKLPTLLHRVWGIKHKHKECGYFFDSSHKEIENILSGLKRSNTAKEMRKDPLLLEDIREISDSLQLTIKEREKNPVKARIAIRDRALFLLGFVSAMRRSEIAALTMQDLKFVEEGIELHITQSKTGERELVIPYGSNPLTCPIRALKAWLQEASIIEGAIFRSINKHGHISTRPLTGYAVALIIKRNGYVQNKINEAIRKKEHIPNFGGHSLRAGFVTTAAKQDIPEDLIMAQTGHKKNDTVKKYIRRANKWQDNAAIRIGL